MRTFLGLGNIRTSLNDFGIIIITKNNDEPEYLYMSIWGQHG